MTPHAGAVAPRVVRSAHQRCPLPRPAGKAERGLATSLLLLTLAGCASPVDVRSLATGRVDIAAYELRGTELPPLRREAQRLCPQGADILHQAERGQRMPPEDARLRRWLQNTSEWLSSSNRQAQMMVLCHSAPVERLPPSAALPLPAAGGMPTASLPTGPLSIEW